VISDTIVPFGVRVDADRDLRAQILTGRIGMVEVTKVSGPPLRVFRTPRLIRDSDPKLFKIDVQVRGRTVFAQGDREAALAPGDFTLLDLSRPCQVADRGDEHEVVAVKFPHAALPLLHDELERVTAALMDLLIVALAERLGRAATLAPTTQRRALLASVQGFIDERLADPELSPSAIAAAHHISLRYLHKLFEAQPTTVSGWIRQRRLERCRRDLLDPALGDWSVSAIAARWGLIDAAHFGRLFRAAYGLPPAEYRLTASTWNSPGTEPDEAARSAPGFSRP
jgi:AraC-like DNA-binding protein